MLFNSYDRFMAVTGAQVFAWPRGDFHERGKHFYLVLGEVFKGRSCFPTRVKHSTRGATIVYNRDHSYRKKGVLLCFRWREIPTGTSQQCIQQDEHKYQKGDEERD